LLCVSRRSTISFQYACCLLTLPETRDVYPSSRFRPPRSPSDSACAISERSLARLALSDRSPPSRSPSTTPRPVKSSRGAPRVMSGVAAAMVNARTVRPHYHQQSHRPRVASDATRHQSSLILGQRSLPDGTKRRQLRPALTNHRNRCQVTSRRLRNPMPTRPAQSSAMLAGSGTFDDTGVKSAATA